MEQLKKKFEEIYNFIQETYEMTGNLEESLNSISYFSIEDSTGERRCKLELKTL